MSVVTNVILTCSLLDEDEDDDSVPALASVQEFLGKNAFKDISSAAGGYKCLEHKVFVTAANVLDTEGLVEAVRHAPWRDRESVQLFVKEQDDEKFSEVPLMLRS